MARAQRVCYQLQGKSQPHIHHVPWLFYAHPCCMSECLPQLETTLICKRDDLVLQMKIPLQIQTSISWDSFNKLYVQRPTVTQFQYRNWPLFLKKNKAIIQTITAARYLVTIEWNHILFSVASMVADHASQSHVGKKISSYSTDTGQNITFTVSLTLRIHEEYSRFRYGNLVFPQTETRRFLMFPTLRTQRKWNTYAHVYGAVLFTGNSCLRRCETWVCVILNTCLHLINYFWRGCFIFFRGYRTEKKRTTSQMQCRYVIVCCHYLL